MRERRLPRIGARVLPWLLLALATLPSVWWVLNYEHDVDPEFPWVVRPTFNAYPPAAYRLGEAGDTIDHIAVYVSSAALVLAGWGWFRNPGNRTWAAAFALSAAGFWHAATPGPLVDGWYGLGWRTILDPRAPAVYRLILSGLAIGLLALVVAASRERPLRAIWTAARSRGILGLLIVAACLVALRQTGWTDREPIGFWPRWTYVWGLLAWAFVLLKVAPKAPAGWSRGAILAVLVVISLSLDFAGRGLFWYQRPLHRLREIVPGRLYISAMPTYEGLKLAQERHHFRTIVNLFPELTPEQSPHWPDELRFIREHGLKYVGNSSTDGRGGEELVAQTLDVARDPSCWPVLVHCHASMDRSPAWMGIYRFVVQGWPLVDAIKEVERHRGLRPKGSVTLLYTSILPQLAPERSAQDPTIALLRECARGKTARGAQVAVRSGDSKAEGNPDRSAGGSSRR
ncbi:MAG: protein tyrosine phosphatase [Isosphaeraceae bacterium]